MKRRAVFVACLSAMSFAGPISAQSDRPLQLALVNYAQHLSGVQIGLVNIIKEGGMFPVFPIVNWGKD